MRLRRREGAVGRKGISRWCSVYLAALPRRSEYRKNRAAGGVTVLAAPGSSLSLLAPTQGATTRLATDSAPLDAARSKVPRWAARLMLGTLAACLRFRRPRGRGRRSPLLNVGARLAAPVAADATTAAVAARFVLVPA
jgi:hypothetical protein